MHDNWLQSFNNYEALQRQIREDREQQLAQQQQLAAQKAQEQQLAREKERREAEARQAERRKIVAQDAALLQQRETEARRDEELRRSEELRRANQERNKVIAEAHARMQEIRARPPPVPYDTFTELAFHDAWKKVHPDIEMVPQRHIGPFRVDFCHEETKIVIELNGSIHSKRRVQNRDAPRHNHLQSLGWRVIIFTNDMVNYSLEACLQEVFACIVERQGMER